MPEKILMILEVSRKQDYIFGRKELRENAARSADIAYVTGSVFFSETVGALYSEADNLVYSGGGHTILQFDNRVIGLEFARKVTEAALRQFSGLEMFVSQYAYNAADSPETNLKNLVKGLERKKALRKDSFRRMSVGVEALHEDTFLPKLKEGTSPVRPASVTLMKAPEGWQFPVLFDELVGSDNFIAVIHIDGNAMGARVHKIYKEAADNWKTCCAKLRRFSEGIQEDFEKAFRRTVDKVIENLDDGYASKFLPIRPVIMAGDDVCFVTAGSLGLEAARIFLEQLSAMTNCEDGAPYAACAGVALVHKKFPFSQAYELAEELCGRAKIHGAALDRDGRISVMDWHIEFGQVRDSLSLMREEYRTEDGCRLELRPVVVVKPDDCKVTSERTYSFFSRLCRSMQGERGKTGRSKIKKLRNALKQGEIEGRFFMHDNKINDLLYHGFSAAYRKDETNEVYQSIIDKKKDFPKDAFREIDGEIRCLYFDAIEIMDHCKFFKEAEI